MALLLQGASCVVRLCATLRAAQFFILFFVLLLSFLHFSLFTLFSLKEKRKWAKENKTKYVSVYCCCTGCKEEEEEVAADSGVKKKEVTYGRHLSLPLSHLFFKN